MSSQIPMFSDAPEALMSSDLRSLLNELRSVLASLKPSNVLVPATWTRRDMGGYDFVMPHRDLPGFSLVARAGDAGDKLSLAYSGCRRKDRGDEFDMAFGVDRAATIQTVALGEDFSDALSQALLEYLQRELPVVRYLSNDKQVVGTGIFWPAEHESERTLLWDDHVRGISLRKPTPVESVAAFHERARGD